MQKLSKQYYYKKDGTRGVNSYKVYLSKKLVEELDIKDYDNLNVYKQGNKIIIEKVEEK
jgi:antitoxin component of MazEF toxin-antitoxin module